jgi:probable O-glycosylation ligase (exosortase A-associated)
MRDIALTLFIFCMLPVILWQPYIGALMWAWVSMMNPHRLAWTFAHDFQFAAVIAWTTLLATAIYRHRKPFPWGPIPALIVLFVAWMTLTSFFAMGHPDEIYATWLRVFKIHLMLLVTFVLIRGREHIDQLIWVMVVSIGFFGIKGGLFTILRGGGERVYGPPGGVIENNNELALALVMIIPLMYYLMTVARRKAVKYGLVCAMILCAFSIVGSHSRGAFLAIVAATAVLALKSRHRVVLGVLGAAALFGIFAFMPEHWWSRMHSMEAGGALDWSAVSRLHTWEALWNMALDNPVTGAGFDTALPQIFARYGPVPGMLAYSPHSIYFQALGEHGFLGLALFLMLVVVSWRKATTVARACRKTPGMEWGDPLMRMVQVSILGFLVGGAFLTLLHFDLPYYLFGLVVMVEATLKEHVGAAAQRAGPHPSRPDARPPQLAGGSMDLRKQE